MVFTNINEYLQCHSSSNGSGRVVVIGLFRPVTDKLDPVSLQVMLLKGKRRSLVKTEITLPLLYFLGVTCKFNVS